MPVDKFGRDPSQEDRVETGVSVRYINNNFLRKDGAGSATGPMDMGKNRITNVVDPIEEHDTATKNYVDRVTLPLDGSRGMRGDINMEGNRIMNVSSATDADDVATNGFVLQQDQNTLNTALGLFMAVDGSTRPVTDISWDHQALKDLASPMEAGDATNKEYVDFTAKATVSLIESNTLLLDGTTKPKHDISWNNKRIIDIANPTNDQDAATKYYVDAYGPRRYHFKLDPGRPGRDNGDKGPLVKTFHIPNRGRFTGNGSYVMISLTPVGHTVKYSLNYATMNADWLTISVKIKRNKDDRVPDVIFNAVVEITAVETIEAVD